MNRRGKRLTLGVMVVGLAVVLVLAIGYRKPILEHFEAWHFQLTRETKTIEFSPDAEGWEIQDLHATFGNTQGGLSVYQVCEEGSLLSLLSSPNMPVIVERGDKAALVSWIIGEPTPLGPVEWEVPTRDLIMRILLARSYRVIEQRFPQKAYVVIRDKTQKGREGTPQ